MMMMRRLSSRSCKLFISVCFTDMRNVPALTSTLQRRVQLQEAQEATLGSDIFTKQSSTIASLDDDWVMTKVAGHLKTHMIIVVRIQAHDEDGPLKLLHLGSQIPFKMALDERMQIKDAASRVIDDLCAHFSHRLQIFQQRKAIDEAGVIDWTKGVYTLEWEADALQSVTHMNGDKIANVCA